MLKELRIKNFAIITGLELKLKSGLNVLTGETGAGKSILIEALGVALGERAYSEMIKTGAESASVEALFEGNQRALEFLKTLGIESEKDIILRRTISAGGKGRAYINDIMTGIQSLAGVGKLLVDIHGQHEHQSLLSSENQLRLLDLYGGLDSEKSALSELYSEVSELKKKLNELNMSARQRAQKSDLLRFQISEIESLAPKPGEDTELESEKALLSNIRRLGELLESAYSELYSLEGSSIERLSKAISFLREMASIDNEVSAPLELLESSLPLIEEAISTLRTFREKRYDPDPSRLEYVEERLDHLKKLKKKYGDTIEEVLEYLNKIKAELLEIEGADEKKEEVEIALKEKENTLYNAALNLSRKRKSVSEKLQKAIVPVLKELAMKNADFKIEIKDAPISPTGIDSVEFLFSANPLEALKPLSKVASGGELSRIMLALKGALREADDISVLIFDEVDSGIGGKTAENVAKKLKALSQKKQVICITHLPQIASVADCHLLIEKMQTKTGVNVIIKELKGDDRKKEIARMLSGNITEASLRHAEELIGGK